MGMENITQGNNYHNNTTTTVRPETETEPPVAADLENPVVKESGTAGVDSIVQRWKREDLIEKSTLVLRSTGGFFSFLSFIIMASNKHGYGREFEDYEEFRYVVGITVLGFLYSMFQVALQGLRITGRAIELCSRRNSAIADFAGDFVPVDLSIVISNSDDGSNERRIRQQLHGFFSSVNKHGLLCFPGTWFLLHDLWI